VIDSKYICDVRRKLSVHCANLPIKHTTPFLPFSWKYSFSSRRWSSFS